MSDYLIDLCETLETLTGFDMWTIQQTLLDSYHWPADRLPDPRNSREMRSLARWLSRRLA